MTTPNTTAETQAKHTAANDQQGLMDTIKRHCAASVAATDGLTTAQLEALGTGGVAKLMRDRDALLAAMREVETICIESAGDCRRRMGTRPGNCIAVARKAIAQSEASK